MAENLPNLMQETDSQVQEHRGSQTRWTHTDPHWDMKVKWKWESLSRVQLSVTPLTIQSMEFSRPFPSPGVLPNPGIEPGSPALQADSLPAELQGKPKNTGVGSLSLLQEIFLTQESNRGLLHCRWILYHLSQQGSPLVFPHITCLFRVVLVSEVKVTQSCPTLCDPMDYTDHGIVQARILEWVAMPSSRGSSQPRDWTQVSHIAGRFFTSWATREAQGYWSE